jgi:hypothetical protein
MKVYELKKNRKCIPYLNFTPGNHVYDEEGNLYITFIRNGEEKYKLIGQTVLIEGESVTDLTDIQYKLFYNLTINSKNYENSIKNRKK